LTGLLIDPTSLFANSTLGILNISISNPITQNLQSSSSSGSAGSRFSNNPQSSQLILSDSAQDIFGGSSPSRSSQNAISPNFGTVNTRPITMSNAAKQGNQDSASEPLPMEYIYIAAAGLGFLLLLVIIFIYNRRQRNRSSRRTASSKKYTEKPNQAQSTYVASDRTQMRSEIRADPTMGTTMMTTGRSIFIYFDC
jgi:hypothetical protein